MVAISSAAILRLSAAAALSYAATERMTRPLIARDRWVSRKRRDLRASDLASLINGMLGIGLADAAETDDMLRNLEYKSSWPPNTYSAAYFGNLAWGQLFEQLIEAAPSERTAIVDSNVKQLPRIIEASLNPLSLQLVWLDKVGARERIDFYGPSDIDRVKCYRPYGAANLLVRKSFLDSDMIILAGEILRDNTNVAVSIDAAATNENAAPGRTAPTRDQDENSIPAADTPENRRDSENAQVSSSRNLGQSRHFHRRPDHDTTSALTS